MSTTHLLPLPRELARVINEFAYKHIDTIHIEHFKNDICFQIKNAYCGHKKTKWYMCAEKIQFQSDFCLKCGNYELITHTHKNYLLCNCL